MVRASRVILIVLSLLAIVPAVAYAQASIAGVVKDASGGVLPGVTVEASSPALIEKVRSAVSDGSGQYRIVDLRPGTYTVTFTLTGFNTVRREGVELTGSFTAAINADMKVGSLSETITVTGESPIVDVQSVRRQTVLSNEILTTTPTARSWYATAILIPAITVGGGNARDIQVTSQMTVFGGAGGRGNEGRMQVDGLNVGAALNGGGVSTYVADISNAQEVTTTTSGGLGEAEVGGPSVSIVPKTGGNTLKGAFYLSGVPPAWVGSNYTDALRTAGLTTPGALIKQWDFTGGLGGPLKKDRLWFFFTARDEGQYRTIPGIRPNLNAGDPTKWTYAPDMSRTAQGAESWQMLTLRLTWQASSRNKFNFHWEEEIPCNGATYSSSIDGCRRQPESGATIGPIGLGALNATTSPELAGYLNVFGARVQQFTWTSTVTNRLLLEAGVGTQLARWGPFEMPGNPTRSLVRMNEQCAGGCAANGNIAGLNYRSANWANNWNGTHTWRGSASYVTGAHSMKFGVMGGYLVHDTKNFTNDHNLSYRVNNGVPNQFTQTSLPYQTHNTVRYDAFYAQEQWTHKRMTLQAALRFDHAWSYFPEQTFGPSNYIPFSVTYPLSEGIKGFKDLSPRGGFVYDVFGNGKTALKVNVGKYLEPASNAGNYNSTNPTARLVNSSGGRTWGDANGNFRVDCDLQSMAAQDLRSSGGDNCGSGNNNYGKQVFGTNYDPRILGGWGVRPDDWGIGVSVQQELLPRVSVEIGYNRRWLRHFNVTDNQLVTAANFDSFSVTAPVDSRLPNGGGYVVDGLRDVTPSLFNQSLNFATQAELIGANQYQKYNGLLVNLSARVRGGLTFSGGLNTGKTVTDNCEVRAILPEGGQTNPYCHNEPGFITRVTGLGSYTIPKLDVLVSGTFRSDQGSVLAANYTVTNAVAARTLGRNLAAGPNGNVSVNLLAPGERWGDRVNEIDLRVAKILRFGRTRTHIGVDVFNLVNSAAVLTYNETFNPNIAAGSGSSAWLAPRSVLTPRFVKLSAQIDF